MLELLSQSQKFSKRFSLELLDVFVLFVQCLESGVLELTQGKGFVCSFGINLLKESVFRVIHLLHDVFLSLNSSLALHIECVLQPLNTKLTPIGTYW